MTSTKSLFEIYREKPYRNIFVALIALVLVDALAPNALARGRFADLMLAAVLVAALVETVRSRHNAIWALALGLPAILDADEQSLSYLKPSVPTPSSPDDA